MTMFKSVVNGVALAGATALLSAGALADGPSRGPQPFSWTGLYVGANVGHAWGNGDLGSSLRCPPPPADGSGCFYPETSPAPVSFIEKLGSKSINSDGFTGGIQAGYNQQHGRIVAGVEVDFNALDLGGSRIGQGLVPDGLLGQTATVGTSFSTDWLLTLRGRLGVALSPSVLAYVTGGLAVSDIKVTNSFSDTSTIVAPSASSRSQIRAGWTVGGGVEWALGHNWTIKGEYLYLDFNSVSTTASVTAIDAGPNTLNTSVDVTSHIARAGINYKF